VNIPIVTETPSDPIVSLRLLDHAGVGEVVALGLRNRSDLENTGPTLPDEGYADEAQRQRLESNLEQCERGTRCYWTIRVNDELAGDIELNHIDRGTLQTANIGYLVDASFRGRGIATAALRLAIRECFGPMGLHRLDAGVLTSNTASQRVLEKAGFRRIGLLERHFYVAGRWRDHLWYEIVGPDVAPVLT
jgi:[ribosomal protein S5]-alanine N-acetyltransferase